MTGPAPEHKYFRLEDVETIITATSVELPGEPIVIDEASDDGDLVQRTLNRKDFLADRLEAAARAYYSSKHFSQAPSASKDAKVFSDIEKASDRLLASLELRDGEDPDLIPSSTLYPLRRRAEEMGKQLQGYENHSPTQTAWEGKTLIDYHGPAEFRDVITGINRLRIWAIECRELSEHRKISGPTRHRGDKDLDKLFGDLAGIWVEIFNRDFGTSVGKPTDRDEGKARGPMVRFFQSILKVLNIELTNTAVRDRIRRLFLGKGKSGKKII